MSLRPERNVIPIHYTPIKCPRTELNRLPLVPEASGLPTTYAPQFTSTVYNTLPMRETLRELNEQAIKDGFLLPDGLSCREDFSDKLGQDLTSTENRIYRIIHDLTKIDIMGIVPVNVEKIFKSICMPMASYQVTDYDIEAAEVLVSSVRKKLGKMAIESIQGFGNHHCEYRSRRKAIELAVKSNLYTEPSGVPSDGIELSSHP